MEGLPVWKPYSNADTIWALPMGGGSPGWVGKTFIRNEVPQRARLSAGRRVQKLFGQCPNSARMTLIGASLHPPPLGLTWGGVLTLAWICRFGALLSEIICCFGALLSAGRGVAKAIWAIPKKCPRDFNPTPSLAPPARL